MPDFVHEPYESFRHVVSQLNESTWPRLDEAFRGRLGVRLHFRV